MRLTVATGCDARMFWQALMLLESAGAAPAVMVCDYGLTPAQAGYLRRRGRLLPRIQDDWPAERRHVFYYKAALGRFLSGLEPDGMAAWLDADTVLAPAAGAALADLAGGLAAAGAAVAACADAIGRFGTFADQVSPAYAPADLFRPSYRAHGLDDDRAYLNVGVLLCRPAFLAAWDSLAQALPPQICLDQNAFNIAAHASGALAVLPAAWNRHSTLLDGVALVDGRPQAGGAPIHVLHATSTLGHVVNRRVTLRHPGGETVAELKLFADPALQGWQLDLFRRAAADAIAGGAAAPDPEAS